MMYSYVGILLNPGKADGVWNCETNTPDGVKKILDFNWNSQLQAAYSACP